VAFAKAWGVEPVALLDAETALHPLRTCAMGPVVDASVFPAVTRDIDAPTLTVAEKAADLMGGAPPPPSTVGFDGHEGARVA
jgi:choline dehydrogenase-like flavoprotein